MDVLNISRFLSNAGTTLAISISHLKKVASTCFSGNNKKTSPSRSLTGRFKIATFYPSCWLSTDFPFHPMKHLRFMRSYRSVNSRVRSVHVGSMQIFVAKFQEKKNKNNNPEGDLRTDKSKNGEGQQCESIWEHLRCHRLYLAAVPLLLFSLWEKVNVFSQKQRRFAGSWNVCLHIPSRPAFRNICCNICSAGFLITPVLFFSFFLFFVLSQSSQPHSPLFSGKEVCCLTWSQTRSVNWTE